MYCTVLLTCGPANQSRGRAVALIDNNKGWAMFCLVFFLFQITTQNNQINFWKSYRSRWWLAMIYSLHSPPAQPHQHWLIRSFFLYISQLLCHIFVIFYAFVTARHRLLELILLANIAFNIMPDARIKWNSEYNIKKSRPGHADIYSPFTWIIEIPV